MAQLTNDAEKMLCSLYKVYLNRRKDGFSKSEAREFEESYFLANEPFSKMNIDDVYDTMQELYRHDYIFMDITGNMELFSPRVYDALAEMVKAYAELNHFDLPADGFDTQMILTKEASERCQIFSAASLKVMSLVPSAQVQKHISGLLADIGNTTYSPSPEHDKIFFQLIADVNAYLLAPKSRKIKNKKHSAQD